MYHLRNTFPTVYFFQEEDTLLPRKETFPREENKVFNVGKEKFLPWNWKVPPLELKSSSLGTKKFQERSCFWNSYVTEDQCDKRRSVVPSKLASQLDDL